ncbi:hypothetical protein ABZZ16_03225 [Streptomyces sp. NPDC006386]|uniref:hypothetical protein n=1 Tax=unclassified Streptomyces TaxID=2593676 RepID=UPI003323D251
MGLISTVGWISCTLENVAREAFGDYGPATLLMPPRDSGEPVAIAEDYAIWSQCELPDWADVKSE